MLALNFVGQQLIDFAKIQRTYNQKKANMFIRQAIFAFDNGAFKTSREKILEAYDLVSESCHLSVIAVRGLEPLVLNEQADAKNHAQLTQVKEALYCSFSELFRSNLHTQAETINKIYQQLRSALIYLDKTG